MEGDAATVHAAKRRREAAEHTDAAAGVDLREFVTRQRAYKTLSQLLLDGPYNEREAAARKEQRQQQQKRALVPAQPVAKGFLSAWFNSLGTVTSASGSNGYGHSDSDDSDGHADSDADAAALEPRFTFNAFYAVYEVCLFMPKMIADMRVLYAPSGKLAREFTEDVGLSVQALIHAADACRAVRALTQLTKTDGNRHLINISLSAQEQEAFKLVKSWMEELRTGVVEALASVDATAAAAAAAPPLPPPQAQQR